MHKVIIHGSFEKHLKMELIEAKNGRARVRMPILKELTNPAGEIHGGAIVSLADSCMAMALASKYGPVLFYTTRLNVKFISPVNKGWIYARAEPVKKKGNFVIGRVAITDDVGKSVAEVETTFFITNKKMNFADENPQENVESPCKIDR